VAERTPEKKKASSEDLVRVVQRAMRRSAYGEPLSEIIREAKVDLGSDFSEIVHSLKKVAAEHGLAGKVFIRAAAFPGLKNGKWKEVIRKKCAGIKYVVANDGEPFGSVLGLEQVASVPWQAALDHYKPLLASTGHKIASKGNPREILRAAFLAGPKALESKPGFKPIEVQAADTITVQEAHERFANSPNPIREKLGTAHKVIGKQRQKANEWIAQKVRAGLISQIEAKRLFQSSAEPRAILAAATDLVAAKKSFKDYDGVGVSFVSNSPDKIGIKKAWEKLAQAEATVERFTPRGASIQGNSSFLSWYKKQSSIAQKMTEDAIKADGTIPTDQVRALFAKDGKLPVAATEKALSLGRQVVASLKHKATSTDYKGPHLTQAASKRASIPEIPDNEKLAAMREIGAGLRWIAAAMNEGAAGKDLDDMIRLRFTADFKKKASVAISELRKKHEGGAGFLYIDPHVYATKTGTTGCEAGATKHRANKIPAVLGMERCRTCKFANIKQASTGESIPICQKYNKMLLAWDDSFEKIKRRNIKAANATDAECTASLFAPKYNQQEFCLESPTDKVELDETPKFEDIGDIFFGKGVEI
jgi:hypothetical protein